MPRLQFWFDFASTYSYLTAMRIAPMAKAAGVEITWRPFLLGPIFNAQGWATSPFVIYPAKGRYMVRDMERIAAERGIPFKPPAQFPANSLLAARLALADDCDGWTGAFSTAVFAAEFGQGADIGAAAILARILADLGIDADDLLTRAAAPQIKEAVRQQTEMARGLGIFGAPSFVTGDGELFWGDDRLEQALAWAAQKNDTRSAR